MRIHLPVTSDPANDNFTPTHPPACYQGSVEPFRKPDHTAKRHSRPARWTERRAKRERQSREWPE